MSKTEHGEIVTQKYKKDLLRDALLHAKKKKNHCAPAMKGSFFGWRILDKESDSSSRETCKTNPQYITDGEERHW